MTGRVRKLALWGTLAAILCAAGAAYWPGTHGAFLLDDYPNIVQNPAFHNARPGLADVVRAVSEIDSGPFGRPIAMASFAVNVWTDGMRPGPMKITNVCIHLLNGLLVFILVRLILGEYRRLRPHARQSTCDWAALAVAAAWVLAPINLTSVLYVVQRMTSLAATFTLGGLICYVAGRRRLLSEGHTRTGVLLLGASGLVFMPLAVLTKEIGVLTPLYALIVEWVFFGFRNSSGRRSKLVLAYFTIFLAIPAVTGLIWLIPQITSAGAYATRPFTLGQRLLTEGRVLWHYAYWTLVPDVSSLTLYHDAFPVSRGLLSPWTTLTSWIGLGAVLAVGVALRRRAPLASFGILWFLAGQVLTATVIPLELVFEHRMYLPSLGLFALLLPPLLLARPETRLRLARSAAALALIALYGGGLVLRSMDWSNPLRHMAVAAREHPDSPRATYGYGRVLAQIAYHDPKIAPRAFEALEKAMRVPGQAATAPSTLIILASRLGYRAKPGWYEQMARTLAAAPPSPQDISALYALVQCALKATHPCRLDPRRMETVFAAALDHRPLPRAAAAIYGNYLLNVVDSPREAAVLFQRLVRAEPSNATYHYDLGVSALASHDADTARRELAVLRKLNPLGVNNRKIAQLSTLIDETAGAHAKHD